MATERLSRSVKPLTSLGVVVAALAVLPWLGGWADASPGQAAALAARATSPAPATQVDQVPTSLKSTAEYSENIYDLAQANDWKAAAARLRLLQGAVRRLSSDVLSAKGEMARLETTIRAIARDVAAKDRLGAMRDANRATWIAANLSASFHPPVPVQVPLLDYGGRELEIWSATANAVKLKAAASDIRQNWDTLRPQVVARGGRAEATTFDGLVARVGSAKSPQQYRVVARPILDEVDKLEKVFGP